MTDTKKVREETIDELLKSLQFTHGRVGNTTITGCWAILPCGFSVAYGQSACIDPANYDPEIGIKIATENCIVEARKRLWEFEGYKLATGC